MKITTLKERIAKAQEKVERKQNTITKKTAQIAKKSDRLAEQYGIDPETFDKYNRQGLSGEADRDIYWTLCDIENLNEDIIRGQKEIENTLKTIEKYEAQLAGELERESILIKDIPENMKQMQIELVDRWDTWDKSRRESLKEEYSELGYKEFMKHHTVADYEFRYKTDEQIHNSNVQDAKALIIDLYNRVKDITGEITDWSNIHAEVGTWGMTVLNGYVEGKEGRASVESILAGGYNIQRLHIRVLVKEYK